LTVLFLLVLALLLAGGAWLYRGQERIVHREAGATLTAIAELKAGQIADRRQEWLDDAAENVRERFTKAALRDWLAKPTPAKTAAVEDNFHTVLSQHGYLEIAFVDAQGRLRLSLTGRGRPGATTLAEVRESIRQRAAMLTELHTDKDWPSVHLAAVAPIFRDDRMESEPLGAAVFVIDAGTRLDPLIAAWPTPSLTAETLLVRREGDDVLFLNNLRHRPGTAMRLRIPLSQADLPAARALRGEEGLVEGKDYRGVPVLAVAQSIPGSNWRMVAKIDRVEALAAWRWRALLIVGLVLALVLAVSAAFLLIWNLEAKARAAEKRRLEEARRETEAQHLTTLMSIGDGVIVTDDKSRVRLMNPVAEALTGWKLDEAKDRPLAEVFVIVSEETGRPVSNPVERVIREGLVVGLANHTLLLSRGGDRTPIADSGAPVRDDRGGILGVVLVFRDQTEERRAEQVLREGKERFESVFQAANVGKSMTRIDGEIDVNQAFCRMLGYEPEELKGRKWQELTPPDDIAVTERQIASLLSGEKDSTRFEKRYIRKDGSWLWCDVSVSLLRDGAKAPRYYVTTVVDIQERKEAEEKLKRLTARQEAILAAAPDIIMEVDNDKVYRWANRAGQEFFGPDVIGRRASDYFEGEQDTFLKVQPLFEGSEGTIYLESWQRRRDGRKRLLSWWCRVLKDASGRVTGALSSARDITELKEVEESWRRILAEREVLLREVHHRVKNNIQLISSLLRLQARALADPAARQILQESQNRIRSMSLIHEKLYKSQDFSRIDFGGYLEDMVGHLLSLYQGTASRVRSVIEANSVWLDINRAIPVGLIVTELVSNALKHAFPGEREGLVEVSMTDKGDERYALSIRDTGVGLPEAFSLETLNSLGLQIVSDLVRQIDGRLTIRREGGTAFLIEF